jgi:Ni/Co efflux regulator RcnB
LLSEWQCCDAVSGVGFPAAAAACAIERERKRERERERERKRDKERERKREREREREREEEGRHGPPAGHAAADKAKQLKKRAIVQGCYSVGKCLYQNHRSAPIPIM